MDLKQICELFVYSEIAIKNVIQILLIADLAKVPKILRLEGGGRFWNFEIQGGGVVFGNFDNSRGGVKLLVFVRQFFSKSLFPPKFFQKKFSRQKKLNVNFQIIILLIVPKNLNKKY